MFPHVSLPSPSSPFLYLFLSFSFSIYFTDTHKVDECVNGCEVSPCKSRCVKFGSCGNTCANNCTPSLVMLLLPPVIPFYATHHITTHHKTHHSHTTSVCTIEHEASFEIQKSKINDTHTKAARDFNAKQHTSPKFNTDSRVNCGSTATNARAPSSPMELSDW